MSAAEIAGLWIDICREPIAIGCIFAICNYLLDTALQAAFGRRERR